MISKGSPFADRRKREVLEGKRNFIRFLGKRKKATKKRKLCADR